MSSRRLVRLPGTGPRSRRFKNTADAVGTIRLSITLIDPERNRPIAGNINRSVRIRGTTVSALARAVERMVAHLVREPLPEPPEATSGVAESVG